MALLGALALAAGGAVPAAHAAGHAKYRVQRVCHTPRPGRAACLSLKLVPSSLSSSELHANAVRQSRDNFAEFVSKKTKELQTQKNCREVEYVVEVINGEVKLKALVKT